MTISAVLGETWTIKEELVCNEMMTDRRCDAAVHREISESRVGIVRPQCSIYALCVETLDESDARKPLVRKVP